MTLTVILTIYLLSIAFLGWKGYKSTKTAADYMVAGRGVHPYIMALSYGATFISTSAIIGFGGAAGVFGLGLLWLTFLNIFVGIFISFVFLGKRTRAMGHHLDAHTFPEFLGKRYQSKFIQIFSGGVILTMVLYAAVVLIGAGRYLEKTFNMDFDIALLVFALIIIIYVIAGGLKGVMYTDALQGSIMFIGMVLLLVFTFINLGGVSPAHKKLNNLFKEAKTANVVQQVQRVALNEGVGLDQAQTAGLVKHFGEIMGETKSVQEEDKKQQIIREKLLDIQIAGIPNLSKKIEPIFKKGTRYMIQKKVIAGLEAKGHQGWTKMPAGGSPFWWLLVSTIILGVGIGVLAQPQLAVRFMTVKSTRELNRAVLIGGVFILMMTGVAFVVGSLSNVWFSDRPETQGLISLVASGMNKDAIMPSFFNAALPKWFNYVLMLSLLSAAMSTLSSQFHAMGTAISRDIFETLGLVKDPSSKKSVFITKIGIGVMLIITVVLGYILPDGYIAAGTALFFGLCAASFLPAYVGGLFWKRGTRIGAVTSIISGFAVSLFWLIFAHVFTLSKWGGKSIFGKSTWSMVDPLLVALPVSAVVFVAVSLLTKPMERKHVEGCFEDLG
jgi:SSS family solute:Na+ symporter